jgi:hypothetical protein
MSICCFKLSGKERFQYLDTSVRLYQAALKGDWQVAKDVFDKYPDLVRRPIAKGKQTTLHIAVLAQRVVFVKELVNMKGMTPDDIALRDDSENTALCLAAGSDMVSIAQEMVKKNEELPLERGISGTPLYMAAVNGCSKMVSYLYDVTPFERLTAGDRINILVATISSDMYGMS